MWFYGTRIKNLSPGCLLRMVRNSGLCRISLLKKECREICRLHRGAPHSMTHLAIPRENLNHSWQDQCTTRNTMQKEFNIGTEDVEDHCMEDHLHRVILENTEGHCLLKEPCSCSSMFWAHPRNTCTLTCIQRVHKDNIYFLEVRVCLLTEKLS